MIPQPVEGLARLYACGITPYDATHLGHAFTYVCVDLLVRAWMDAGLLVHYAQNVTDIDEPLLERAERDGVDYHELAAREVEIFRKDMTALRVLPPHTYQGVEESMPLVVDMVDRLIKLENAYQVPDPEYPDWYFALDTAPLVLQHAESRGVSQVLRSLFAERGGDPGRPGKRNPLDPLLWRLERPGEPAWDAPFGRGRPGWHAECAAIATDALGTDFQVQAGGHDLIYPHHPYSATEAQCANGATFAQAFVHAGLVGLGGERMSKSKGNLVFVHKLLEQGWNPMVIRLLLVSHHYRPDWEFEESQLAQAQERLVKLARAVLRLSAPPARPVIQAMRAAMADDLNAPAALAAVERWAEEDGDDIRSPRLVADAVDALLGLRITLP
jgi:L-cysteine:1D-myo-inositol 2-amino-2-deoxy-alpha-D-glucopyranoside ligase